MLKKKKVLDPKIIYPNWNLEDQDQINNLNAFLDKEMYRIIKPGHVVFSYKFIESRHFPTHKIFFHVQNKDSDPFHTMEVVKGCGLGREIVRSYSLMRKDIVKFVIANPQLNCWRSIVKKSLEEFNSDKTLLEEKIRFIARYLSSECNIYVPDYYTKTYGCEDNNPFLYWFIREGSNIERVEILSEKKLMETIPDYVKVRCTNQYYDDYRGIGHYLLCIDQIESLINKIEINRKSRRLSG